MCIRTQTLAYTDTHMNTHMHMHIHLSSLTWLGDAVDLHAGVVSYAKLAQLDVVNAAEMNQR